MRAARVDLNHAAIVRALRSIGCSVWSTAATGKGGPDLVCGYRGMNYLFEVKRADGKLNVLQQRWHDAWRGNVVTVRTPEEAIEVVTGRKL